MFSSSHFLWSNAHVDLDEIKETCRLFHWKNWAKVPKKTEMRQDPKRQRTNTVNIVGVKMRTMSTCIYGNAAHSFFWRSYQSKRNS